MGPERSILRTTLQNDKSRNRGSLFPASRPQDGIVGLNLRITIFLLLILILEGKQ